MRSHWTTERLIITFLTETHAPQLLTYDQENAEFRREWSQTPPDNFLTLEFQKNRLHNEIAQREQDRSYTFWLFERADVELHTIIGFVGLRNLIRGAMQGCHVGYEIHHAYGGRGYMPEALRKVSQIAFEEMNLHRLEANIIPRNQRSIRVAEKAGFINEGRARNYLKINGIWQDHDHYVLLNEAMEQSSS